MSKEMKRVLAVLGLLGVFALGLLAGGWGYSGKLSACSRDLERTVIRGIQVETHYQMCRIELERERQK